MFFFNVTRIEYNCPFSMRYETMLNSYEFITVQVYNLYECIQNYLLFLSKVKRTHETRKE